VDVAMDGSSTAAASSPSSSSSSSLLPYYMCQQPLPRLWSDYAPERIPSLTRKRYPDDLEQAAVARQAWADRRTHAPAEDLSLVGKPLVSKTAAKKLCVPCISCTIIVLRFV
jgi:hypothetical protein